MKTIKKNWLVILLAIGAALAAMGLASPSKADPIVSVCSAISQKVLMQGEAGYASYLIDAIATGKQWHIDWSEQSKNIADSVYEYCPVHAPGLSRAAAMLTRGKLQHV